MEVFNDWIKCIDFLYVFEYEQEVEIYWKMFWNVDVFDIYVELYMLEMFGLFGVLMCIVEFDFDIILFVQKVKVYNGELDDGDDVDVCKFCEEGEKKVDIVEGMDGVFVWFIGDEIVEVIMDVIYCGWGYFLLLLFFIYFEENFENYGLIFEENFECYYCYFEMVCEEYKECVIEDVCYVFVYDIDEICWQGEKYMDYVMVYIDDVMVEDELMGCDQDFDEKFFCVVEEKFNIFEDCKDDF